MKTKFHIMGDVRDRLQNWRTKKTTRQEDRFLTLSALRDRRQSSKALQNNIANGSLPRQSGPHCTQPVSSLTGPAITALHHQVRLHWCLQHVQWNLNIWSNVLFGKESRFCL